MQKGNKKLELCIDKLNKVLGKVFIKKLFAFFLKLKNLLKKFFN